VVVGARVVVVVGASVVVVVAGTVVVVVAATVVVVAPGEEVVGEAKIVVDDGSLHAPTAMMNAAANASRFTSNLRC
jgi:hypothetical protein